MSINTVTIIIITIIVKTIIDSQILDQQIIITIEIRTKVKIHKIKTTINKYKACPNLYVLMIKAKL